MFVLPRPSSQSGLRSRAASAGAVPAVSFGGQQQEEGRKGARSSSVGPPAAFEAWNSSVQAGVASSAEDTPEGGPSRPPSAPPARPLRPRRGSSLRRALHRRASSGGGGGGGSSSSRARSRSPGTASEGRSRTPRATEDMPIRYFSTFHMCALEDLTMRDELWVCDVCNARSRHATQDGSLPPLRRGCQLCTFDICAECLSQTECAEREHLAGIADGPWHPSQPAEWPGAHMHAQGMVFAPTGRPAAAPAPEAANDGAAARDDASGTQGRGGAARPNAARNQAEGGSPSPPSSPTGPPPPPPPPRLYHPSLVDEIERLNHEQQNNTHSDSGDFGSGTAAAALGNDDNGTATDATPAPPLPPRALPARAAPSARRRIGRRRPASMAAQGPFRNARTVTTETDNTLTTFTRPGSQAGQRRPSQRLASLTAASETGTHDSTADRAANMDVDAVVQRTLQATLRAFQRTDESAAEATPKWQPLPFLPSLDITFDRLRLTQVVDRYKRHSEVAAIALLVFFSTWLAFEVSRFYYDIGQVVLWIVLTTAQFSLIRSVQPDAASSSVDERSTALSRPLYFCAVAATILALDAGGTARPWTDLTLYNVPLHSAAVLLLMRNVLLVLLLVLPILFVLGVFPVWRTALHHAAEQVDMHVFGGSGTATVAMAWVRLALAGACLALVYALALGLFDLGGGDAPAASMWFAAFGGAVVAMGDWLGRMPTDTPGILWSRMRRWCGRHKAQRRLRRESRSLVAASRTLAASDAHDKEAAAAAAKEKSKAEDSRLEDDNGRDSSEDGGGESGGDENGGGGNAGESGKPADDSGAPPPPPTTGTATATAATGATAGTAAQPMGPAGAMELDAEDDPRVQDQRLSRLGWDSVTSLFTGVIWLAVCSTGVFHAAPETLARISIALLAVCGLAGYLILPQLRAAHPFQCGMRPVLGKMPAAGFAKVPDKPTWYEQATFFLQWTMSNVLVPVALLSSAAASIGGLQAKWGPGAGALLLAVCALKLSRASRGALGLVYVTLPLTLLFFAYDYKDWTETLIVDFAFGLFLGAKLYELLLKVQFIVTYNAPWHIKDVWGSTAHAILYPLAIPHTAVVFLQACIASILSAPVYPLMGTAVFLVSYFRPLRFWERNYSTKERDRNTRRLDALHNQPTANSLNAVFYLHVQVGLLAGEVGAGEIMGGERERERRGVKERK